MKVTDTRNPYNLHTSLEGQPTVSKLGTWDLT